MKQRSVPSVRRISALVLSAICLMAAVDAHAGPSGVVLTPSAASPFSVGLRPTGVATGDFNNDGKQDIAITNAGNNNVTVLLGNGAGTFTAAPGSPFSAGFTPMAIVVKDFNKDGNPDLAVVNQQSNNVTILMGNGTGGFAAATGSPFAVGGTPNFAATGDFNGDTIPDLAVTNSSSNTVTLLLGDGTGKFTPSAGSPFPTGLSPEGVVAADFDADGKTDLAVADGGDGNVTYLFGDGTGGFSLTTHAQGCNPGSAIVASLYGMVAGNFYNHAYTDLVTVSSGANEINILRGFGNGTDSYNNQFSPGPALVTLAAGDFDQDGNLDVAVVAGGNNGTVSIVLGNGNGGFNIQTEPYYSTGRGSYGVAVADFNGDGKLDVVVTNSTDNTITILLTPGAPLVAPAPPVTQVQQTITFAVANHLGSDPAFPLQATASSGLPVAFSVLSGPATVSGNMLTLTGLGTVTVQASQGGSNAFAPAAVVQSFSVALGAPVITSVVNGASFLGGLVPTSYYATIFGSDLVAAAAQGDATSSQILAGATVNIVDAAKSAFTADLWFASYGQINFVVPTGVAAGPATVTVTNATGKSASIQVTVGAVFPGLYSADGTGSGMAMADVVIVARDGSQAVQPTAVETPFGPISVPIPLTSGTQIYLVVYGTGIRGRSGLPGVTMTVGGVPLPVTYAGSQGNYPALDQVIALLPTSLTGAGNVKVQLTVDGITSNAVTVRFP
jgi:uncharacterized protein (TIGR03437 family)